MRQITSALDAWAVLALLRDEPGAAEVYEAMQQGSVCSWINLGEVLYVETRRLGNATARRAVERVADNIAAELPDAELITSAASVKAAGGLSYADSFAVATAERHGVRLLTGDPELTRLERATLDVVDLRAR